MRDIDNDIDLNISQVVPVMEYHKPISEYDKKKINELKVLRKDLKLLNQINNLEEKRTLIRDLEIKIKNLENHLENKGKLTGYLFM